MPPTTPLGAPTPTVDSKLERVRRAFDAAADRLRAATTQAEVEDELSNMLHHLYRLGELCRWRLAKPPAQQLSRKDFGERLRRTDDLRAARAAMWVRAADTHDLVAVELATPPDTYGDVYGDVYGAVDWKPVTQADPHGRRDDYAKVLEGRSVLDTTCRAFEALAALL
jgi:hypothetical protein